MIIKEITVVTRNRNELVNITREIESLLSDIEFETGKITLFVPHTTAAVTINENADPSVVHDMLFSLSKISPVYDEFNHMEGNSDAHVKSTIVGNTQDVFFSDKQLILGTWQGIFFCEFDGARTRRVKVFISE